MCRRFNSCQHHIKPSDPEGFIIFPLLTLHLSPFTSHLSSLIPPILSHFGFPSHERIPGFVRHLSSVDFLANKYPGFARLMAFGYPRTNKCPRFVRPAPSSRLFANKSSYYFRNTVSDWPFANKKAFYVREVDPGGSTGAIGRALRERKLRFRSQNCSR